MKPNPKARIEITHSKRFGQSIVKTWSALGWEWFGPKHPALPVIYEALRATGKATYSGNDSDGTFYFKSLDNIELPETKEA